MARPICKQFLRPDLSSLHQRIRSQGRTLAKMEDPRVPCLIKGPASGAILRHRLTGHRLTVRPSRFHQPTDPRRLVASGERPKPISFYAVASLRAANAVSLRSSAQAIRASLLASATTTVLACARASRPRSQLPSGVAVRASDGRAARAP